MDIRIKNIKSEVERHLAGMDSQIPKVKDKIDEVRKKTIVEQNRENCTTDIILYNVQETGTANRDERRKENGEFCLVLFNSKILKVPITDKDIKRLARLGKVNWSVQQGAIN